MKNLLTMTDLTKDDIMKIITKAQDIKENGDTFGKRHDGRKLIL